MEHVVIFGGTGMLLKATKWLDKSSTNTIVYGRNINRSHWMADRNNEEGFHFYYLDYNNTDKVRQCIRQSIEEFKEIDLVLNWIHSSAINTTKAIINEINLAQNKQWRLIHVKGSNNQNSIENDINISDKCLSLQRELCFCSFQSFSLRTMGFVGGRITP